MKVDDRYFALIKEACERVRRTKGIDVRLFSMEFYGVHRYSHEKTYKAILMTGNGPLAIYLEEGNFESWTTVPWSGLSEFMPKDFNDWPKDKKLTLAWCWAIYKYCKEWSGRRNGTPPPIE